MGLKNRYSIYPISEAIHIESEGVTPVNAYSIPDGAIIDLVLAYVKKAAIRTAGAVTLTVGDNDTADGFIPASDAKATAGTVYGDDPTERGSYLYDATKKGSFRKVYTADKLLKFALNTAPDANGEGEYVLFIFGHRAMLL